MQRTPPLIRWMALAALAEWLIGRSLSRAAIYIPKSAPMLAAFRGLTLAGQLALTLASLLALITLAAIAFRGRRNLALSALLSALVAASLVSMVVLLGGWGALLYRAARHGVIQGFPRRHYEVLAEVALRALVSEAGPERATVLLREMGVGVGRSMVESIAARAGVREWTPEAFQRHFLEGAMRDFGIASTILSRTSRSIEYRCFTCPFLEAAEKMSDLVCDSLDVGFHEGVNQAMGPVSTERIACMGHGSPFCQYRVVWRAAPARRRRSRTTGGV